LKMDFKVRLAEAIDYLRTASDFMTTVPQAKC
jgi:hypothetical protein